MSTAAVVREQHGHDESMHTWVPPHIRSPLKVRALGCLRPLFGCSGILHLSSMPPEGVLCPLRSLSPCNSYKHEQDLRVAHTLHSEGLVAGANLRTPWCGPRTWSRSASWQPCATAKAFPSSPSAQAPAWRVESARSRYARRVASSAGQALRSHLSHARRAASSAARGAPYLPSWSSGLPAGSYELRSSWRKT